MTAPHTLEARSSGPPTDLLALAWLAGYSSPKTRRTYQTMIRSCFDWSALCGFGPLAARRAHVEVWQRALEQHFQCIWSNALARDCPARLAIVPDGCVDIVWVGVFTIVYLGAH